MSTTKQATSGLPLGLYTSDYRSLNDANQRQRKVESSGRSVNPDGASVRRIVRREKERGIDQYPYLQKRQTKTNGYNGTQKHYSLQNADGRLSKFWYQKLKNNRTLRTAPCVILYSPFRVAHGRIACRSVYKSRSLWVGEKKKKVRHGLIKRQHQKSEV